MSATGSVRPIVMTEQTPAQQQHPIVSTPSFPAPPVPGLSGPRLVGSYPQLPVSVPETGHNSLRNLRTATEYSSREYLLLQNQRRYDDPVAENRLRIQRDVVLADLKALRSNVALLVKAGESHRWGRWVLGGFL